MTSRHARLRVLQPETPYLNLVGSGTPRPVPDDELTIRDRYAPNYVLAAVAGEAQTPRGADSGWSPPDPDVLHDALAALRQLA